MAVVKGTNSGFVTAAPLADPSGTVNIADTIALGQKDTTPAGTKWRVTEIGWWCDNATQEASFDVGIYSHDAGNNRPNKLIGSSKNNAKGTTAGWKKVGGLNIILNASTIYWIAYQLDDTATTTNTDQTPAVGEKWDNKYPVTELPDAWGASYNTGANLFAVYALIEEIKLAGILNWWFMRDSWEKHDKIWKPKILKPEFEI